jgi:Lon protease-like protein
VERRALSDEAPEYLDVAILPLPNVTFFEGTRLPLHVFEDRYREMVANVLAGDRLIGVALLREGWQRDYFGTPPIHKTFGVGKVVDFEQFGDGRYRLVLEGRYRARLTQEFPTRPFRSGRVQVLQDPPIDGHRALVGSLMKELRDLAARMAVFLPALRETIQAAWAAHPHPLVVTGHLAQALVVDAYDRQSILEQDDPIRRFRLLAVQMRAIVAQIEVAPAQVEEVMGED